MEVKLKSAGKPLNYIGENKSGHTLSFSATKEAVGAMESVLMAVAACSSVDVENILKKTRQDLKDISVTVKGERADGIPAVFTKIHLHYVATGKVKKEKLDKAVQMSMEQYCSVSMMLKKSVEITFTTEVVETDNE